MTNPLIMQLKIKETSIKKEIRELKIKISRLVNELSVYIGTYYGECEDIDAKKIKQSADELFSVKNRIANLNIKLKSIRKELY